MTYQEKYAEVYNRFQEAGKTLESATEKLSSVNGFGDMSAVPDYFQATKTFKNAEWAFQNMLKYAQSETLNPDAEFNYPSYMYDVIKKDQQERGTPWPDNVTVPAIGDGSGIKFYSSNIGLTNDPDIHDTPQSVEYKFPVVDLNHGKECYAYLSSMLGENISEEQMQELDFKKVLNFSQPIYVRVELTIMT